MGYFPRSREFGSNIAQGAKSHSRGGVSQALRTRAANERIFEPAAKVLNLKYAAPATVTVPIAASRLAARVLIAPAAGKPLTQHK